MYNDIHLSMFTQNTHLACKSILTVIQYKRKKFENLQNNYNISVILIKKIKITRTVMQRACDPTENNDIAQYCNANFRVILK